MAVVLDRNAGRDQRRKMDNPIADADFDQAGIQDDAGDAGVEAMMRVGERWQRRVVLCPVVIRMIARLVDLVLVGWGLRVRVSEVGTSAGVANGGFTDQYVDDYTSSI